MYKITRVEGKDSIACAGQHGGQDWSKTTRTTCRKIDFQKNLKKKKTERLRRDDNTAILSVYVLLGCWRQFDYKSS